MAISLRCKINRILVDHNERELHRLLHSGDVAAKIAVANAASYFIDELTVMRSRIINNLSETVDISTLDDAVLDKAALDNPVLNKPALDTSIEESKKLNSICVKPVIAVDETGRSTVTKVAVVAEPASAVRAVLVDMQERSLRKYRGSAGINGGAGRNSETAI